MQALWSKFIDLWATPLIRLLISNERTGRQVWSVYLPGRILMGISTDGSR